MSEFCKECSIMIFGEDYNDFKNIAKEGEVANVLCEECGSIQVDHTGKRIKCEYDPMKLANTPIGQFHCPKCGEMVIAGMPHG